MVSSAAKSDGRSRPERTTLPRGLRPATTSSMVDHIVDELRKTIVSGELPPNSRLVELDLAERFGVSRGPIREALSTLQLLGLVTLRPNRGAVVRAIGPEDVLEVYFLRAALGVVAIRQLIGADRITPRVADRLTALEAKARTATTRKRQRLMVEADLAFQSAIVDACELPRVIARFAETTDEVSRFVTTSGIVYPDVDRIVDDHANLLRALLNRDADHAVELWRARMRTAVEEFLALIPDGKKLGEQRPWLWELL
jgi:GntR family transcriptional regulator, trigonelline degradation regulator